MKRKVYSFLIVSVISLLIFYSCKKDDSTQPTNFTRDDYVGSWDGTEVPVVKNQTFICDISADPNVSSNIKMVKFANIAGTAYAVVSGANITIPKQTVGINIIEGYGTMQNKSYITWHYYVNDGADSLVYNTTFNKR